MQRYFTITQLTQEFDITTRTLRFYEAQGLVLPQRRGRQRLYTPGDRTRIKLILRGKRLGFSLNEIKEVLSQMGLHLGMEISEWPPENIEDMAKKLEDPF